MADDDKPERCSEGRVELIPPRVGDANIRFRRWVWHPQWGGYVAVSHVDFDHETGASDGSPGCFELSVYHDGEFPRDHPVFRFHCCDPVQFIRFGLDVLETQVAYQEHREQPVEPDRRALFEIQRRVDALLERDGEVPYSRCPHCGRWEPDHDGFGVLAHTSPPYDNGCGYCSHPSADDGVCGLCGASV